MDCFRKFNVGENHVRYKGKPSCVDCDKTIHIGSKRCVSCFHKTVSGKNSPLYKEKLTYKYLHTWVSNMLGRPKKCLHCNKPGCLNKGNKWSIQWANKSQQYLRDLNDWIPLCCKCHYIYDRKNK